MNWILPFFTSVALIPTSTLDYCIEKELAACGDKVCEMSYDSNYPIVKQTLDNVKECIEKELAK